MIVVGIDPGKTGAMVILNEDMSCTACRVPLMKKPKEVPAWGEWAQLWGDALEFSQPDMVVMEAVGARPGQGVTSMFSFGTSMGYAHGLVRGKVLQAAWHFPTPGQWKAKFGLLKADKSASREKVRQLIPTLTNEVTRVKDDGVAEAALLAYYGRKYLCL